MSKRTDIRSAVVNVLKAGGTLAGQQVFSSKYTALFTETYPLILVATESEELETAIVQPAQYFRKLKLVISAGVIANDAMDDQLDLLGAQIEALMAKDPTVGNVSTGAVLKSIELQAVESEQLFGAIHLTYEMDYFA